MDEIDSSDLTMVASNAFRDILDKIQSSCLNFQLQLSPFTAVISLKKSLVKDISGKPLLPPSPCSVENTVIENLMAKNKKLEQELNDITQKYEKVANECAIACITVDDYKVKLRAQENVIHDLELANKNATEAAKQLNKMHNDNRAMFEKEMAQILKGHK